LRAQHIRTPARDETRLKLCRSGGDECVALDLGTRRACRTYIGSGFTAQVEVTLLQLSRVKGDAPVAPDASRTNFTTGIHVGYFVLPVLSLGAELRHQRWLSTPTAIKTNSAARDTSTVAFGPRFHMKLNATMWLRPAVSFALPLDDPMQGSEYKLFQLDVPFVF
jgi:hypothetical protein